MKGQTLPRLRIPALEVATSTISSHGFGGRLTPTWPADEVAHGGDGPARQGCPRVEGWKGRAWRTLSALTGCRCDPLKKATLPDNGSRPDGSRPGGTKHAHVA
jgi:hypothetical protein